MTISRKNFKNEIFLNFSSSSSHDSTKQFYPRERKMCQKLSKREEKIGKAKKDIGIVTFHNSHDG